MITAETDLAQNPIKKSEVYKIEVDAVNEVNIAQRGDGSIVKSETQTDMKKPDTTTHTEIDEKDGNGFSEDRGEILETNKRVFEQ